MIDALRRMLWVLWLTVVICGFCDDNTAWARRGKERHKKERKHRREKGKKPATKPTKPDEPHTSETPDAAAEHGNRVSRLLREAKAALDEGNVDAALKKAEAAFKKERTGDILCLLGQIAAIQSRAVDAHDLFRRCLADPTVTIDAAVRTDAQKHTARPVLPTGELHVLGEKDALLLVDDGVRGSLPLVLPLRLAAGSHSVAVVASGHTSRGTVEVLAGQAREMRFDALTSAVLLSVPPPLVLVKQPGPTPPDAFLGAIERGTQIAGYSLLLQTGKIDECDANETVCLQKTATHHKASLILALAFRREDAACVVNLSAWNAQIGEVSASESVKLLPCVDGAQLVRLADAVASTLLKERARPRGELAVQGIPKDAQVKVDERAVGILPWQGSLLAGPHKVVVFQPGYEPFSSQTTVFPGKKATVSVLLSPVLGSEPSPGNTLFASVQIRRPLWRVIGGAAAVGVGILLIGIGGSGLAANGTCVPPLQPPAVVCRETLQTTTVGGSLLGVGLGLTIGGAVLVAIP